MPVDVEARVLSNVRLSAEYNVVALEVPAVAVNAQPGQFVMIKAAPGHDPLLRRPFSIFEILRDAEGAPTGLSLLNKRVGVSTRQLFAAEPDDRIACLGPLGRPFTPVDPPAQAWMVAGGVGLAPFVTLAEALRAGRTDTTLFYGGRRSSDLYHLETFERLGVGLVLATEDGSRGERGLITGPVGAALRAMDASQPLMIYACGPTGMMREVARSAMAHDRSCEVSLEQVMGCGLGGCYSCVVRVRDDHGRTQFVRSCMNGPVLPADRIVWDELVA